MLLSDKEEKLVERLTDSIASLASEIHAHGSSAVTRCDLAATEARLTALLQPNWEPSSEDKALLEGLLKRSERIVKRIEKLDAKTPPASTTAP